MKKLLILTASFGDGHNAAARNLREAIELLTDDAKVEVLDLFESTYSSFNTLLKHAYNGLVRYAPSLWSTVFATLDNPTLFNRQRFSASTRNGLFASSRSSRIPSAFARRGIGLPATCSL